MTIKFYYNIYSPPSRAVWMTLKALKIKSIKKVVDILNGDNRKPEYLAINPMGRIPSLVDGKFAIGESRAIATYLCNKYEKNGSKQLYPKDAEAKGVVDQMLYISESIEEMVEKYVNLGGVLMAGQTTNVDKIDELRKALALCEGFLKDRPYMAGKHLTLADIFMLSPLLLVGYTTFDEQQKYPKLAAWMKKMKALPYFDECQTEGLAGLGAMYKKNMAKIGGDAGATSSEEPIKFYYNPFSPPSRAAWMTLKALKVKSEDKVVDLLTGEQKKPEYLAINPMGRVPSVLDGKTAVGESRAVATYLCNKYDKSGAEPLYPKDDATRALVDQMLYVSESIDELMESYTNLTSVLFAGQVTKVEKVEEVRKALALVEGFLKDRPFIAAKHLTVADFFMLTPLLLLHHTTFDEYENYPKTAAWEKRMRALPYFDQCQAEGLAGTDAMYKASIAKAGGGAPEKEPVSTKM